MRAYRKALAKPGVTPALLLLGAKRYAAETAGRARDKIALPASWLNDERWNDEGIRRTPTHLSVVDY